MIEEQQKRERLVLTTKEEDKLNIQIETLTELGDAVLQPKIEKLQQQLAIVQQQKNQTRWDHLPDLVQKTESKIRIQEKENELLSQIGFSF